MVPRGPKILLQIIIGAWQVGHIVTVEQSPPVTHRHAVEVRRPGCHRLITLCLQYLLKQRSIRLRDRRCIRPLMVGEHVSRPLQPHLGFLEW